MKDVSSIVYTLLFCSSLFAQSPQLRNEIKSQQDEQKNKEIIQQFSREVMSDKEAVLRFQQQYSVPTKGVYKDGRIYQLRTVDNEGIPIYYATQNALSRSLTGVDNISKGGRQRVNLQGRNMIIGLWDGKPAFEQHQEFKSGASSRVILKDPDINIAKLNGEDLERAELGKNHATHVAGTLIASGAYAPAKGLAPEASVWSYDWDNDIVEMASAAQSGLLISNHSYGIAALDDYDNPLVPPTYFGYYNKDAYQLDKLTYTYPYYQPVISAGNDREYYDKINPTMNGNDLLLGNTNAKNAVVVAAVGVDNSDRLSVAKFSSYGPTGDFRIKPDIAAPGVKIISSAYELPRYHNANPSVGVYKEMSGTSMASPVVSAILTLWQQGYVQLHDFPMRSATLRGLMTHTAEYLEEKYPTNKIGWGMINAERGIEFIKNVNDDSAVLKESVLFNKKDFRYKFKLDNPSERLLVTLSWTDREALFDSNELKESFKKNKLINDLDIRLYKDGEEYFPWYLNKNRSNLNALKGDNDVDNLERIEIVNPEAGEYEVVVSHKGELSYGRQDFSLLISNGDLDGIEKISTIEGVEPEDIVIWPNPVQDIANVEVTKDKVFTISEVEVFDLSNRLVKRFNFTATNRAVIDMRELERGVYLLNINVGGERVRAKILKK
ncbi:MULTISPECIES: S8 family serine peptidase [Myroides]|uniref:Peptidase S8 n=1 Tax=Myroides odoratimimus TaxID=76832 RepID=A0AAI8G5G7_9FLAO|nr:MULTISPECIES: S8 family serine peptidase [Myroides]ALU26743.1 hypothetical protein AS202_11550 [Myroides odoratimimus]APA92763.1 hypothetical protein BK054_11155 [Myroides sp. ZB35]MDM1035111.1 S8 family serine peptidase [Myroides odoratimimus]MDM1037777.1 S8 family serine peptidase [Myroides odoratimimus]MDM1052090.1 S8 family serine peptidase [Myroides odoratimimus]